MCLTAQCTSTSCSTPSSSWLPVLPPILFTSTTLSGLSSILKQPVSVNYTNKLRHYWVSKWGINKGCKHIEKIDIERRCPMKVYTLLILTQTNIYLLSQCVRKNFKNIFLNFNLEASEYHSNFKENKIFHFTTCIHFWDILFWFTFYN